MRTREKVILLAWAMLIVGVASAQVGHDTTVARLNFDTDHGQACEASVVEVTPSAPRRQFTITCDGKRIFQFITEDHLVNLQTNYPKGDRIAVWWEGGSHVRLTVFKIETTPNTARTVYDEPLEFAPDFLTSPDRLLVYRDKRFVRAVGIPTRTDIYEWTGSEYRLAQSYHWNENMRFEDRFCVLDTKSLACPVTPTTH